MQLSLVYRTQIFGLIQLVWGQSAKGLSFGDTLPYHQLNDIETRVDRFGDWVLDLSSYIDYPGSQMNQGETLT